MDHDDKGEEEKGEQGVVTYPPTDDILFTADEFRRMNTKYDPATATDDFKKSCAKRPLQTAALAATAVAPLGPSAAGLGRVFSGMALDESECVEMLIAGEVGTTKNLEAIAPKVNRWLLANLHLTHESKQLKQQVKKLLGVGLYTANLDTQHCQAVWSKLQTHCTKHALQLGEGMDDYFETHDLGKALGFPNTFGKAVRVQDLRGGVGADSPNHRRVRVESCAEWECSKRQDSAIPTAFPLDPRISQLANEKAYIHVLRMIAAAIDLRYQKDAKMLCEACDGFFKNTAIKGFSRMKNKCVSPDDHGREPFPRPSLNIDINRNACTFETCDGLLKFVQTVKTHVRFGGSPIRIKNMFLFDKPRAEQQFHYRTVMVNWLYTPGTTYGEMAEEAAAPGGLWDTYLNFEQAPGFGDKDVAEPWCHWRRQIRMAQDFLTSEKLRNEQVQFIVEMQMLLRPYLEGRLKMHLLYKVGRADTPVALFQDFNVGEARSSKSFTEVETEAVDAVKRLLLTNQKPLSLALRSTSADDLAFQKDMEFKLWDMCANGHEAAAKMLLGVEGLQVNQPKAGTATTPLFAAAMKGHEGIVRLLLEDGKFLVNKPRPTDGSTPLCVACQNGHEGVVDALLDHPDCNVNEARTDGGDPLYMASQNGHDWVVQQLVGHPHVQVNNARSHGQITPLAIASLHGHERVVQALLEHLDIMVNLPTEAGFTPLDLAQHCAHSGVARLLEDHGARPTHIVRRLHRVCVESGLCLLLTGIAFLLPGHSRLEIERASVDVVRFWCLVLLSAASCAVSAVLFASYMLLCVFDSDAERVYGGTDTGVWWRVTKAFVFCAPCWWVGGLFWLDLWDGNKLGLLRVFAGSFLTCVICMITGMAVYDRRQSAIVVHSLGQEAESITSSKTHWRVNLFRWVGHAWFLLLNACLYAGIRLLFMGRSGGVGDLLAGWDEEWSWDDMCDRLIDLVMSALLASATRRVYSSS
jgi:ankyrin repeat protein